jgi:gamma-glutamylcyclotransferase (GGCT)/AIG2-like uncharacterized protein YtfP
MDREPTNGYQLYFAYGSNMLEQRLKERVKSAKFLCNAWISSYVVQCRKMSIDGSGKADLVDTGLPEDIVYGVVYEFDPADWFELDKHEGAAGNNPGYERVPIRVYTDSAAIDVATYLARKERIDESLKPYTWYRDLILRGAEQHSLPEDYLQKIVKILDIRDPVENRPEKIEAERQIKKYLASIDH